jgi:hypothetical protein
MNEPVLEELKKVFKVKRIRYDLTCPKCGHSWNLNVSVEEYEARTDPNPNWMVCWPCRHGAGDES